MDRVADARSLSLRGGWRFVFAAGAFALLSLIVLIGVARPSVTSPAHMANALSPAVDALVETASPVAEPEAVSAATRDDRRVVTMLHGAGSSVEGNCQSVTAAVPEGFVLLCPAGNRAYGDGHADWAGEGEEKATHLDAALGESARARGLPADRGGDDVLVGFSRGAFVARDVVYARPGRYSGLVLIGAALVPDPQRLKDSGIKRVVLASGELDGAYKTMRSAETKLRASGIEVRFVSLGKVYHTLPADTSARLAEPMRWVAADG